MNGTKALPNRERKPRPRVDVVVRMRPGVLKRLYAGTGLTRYKDIAADLGYLSVSALNEAARGWPVNIDLVAVIRNRFPLVPYEEVFVEGARDVPAAKRAA